VSRVAATDEPLLPMTREEYRAWAMAQPRGHFERINGVVVAMAPERVSHAIIKARVWRALDAALASAGLDNCRALPDGVTVEVEDSDYEPDAIVHCGPLDLDGVSANNPVVIVEVLSPSTSSNDRGLKLAAYFRLPSLRHYLIVWADKQQVLHHRRGDDGGIDTNIITGGAVRLEPPGLTITIEDIYV
jgi:Uma2 family endonuclease